MRTALPVAALFFALTALAGCSTQADRSAPPPLKAGLITPMEAVRAANDRPRNGVAGTFVLTVRAVGRDGSRTYINSETDYRHQTNLSVVVEDSVRPELERQIGMPLEQLRGRMLMVDGMARRTPIIFTVDGKPSGKYYYQTQLALLAAEQVVLVN